MEGPDSGLQRACTQGCAQQPPGSEPLGAGAAPQPSTTRKRGCPGPGQEHRPTQKSRRQAGGKPVWPSTFTFYFPVTQKAKLSCGTLHPLESNIGTFIHGSTRTGRTRKPPAHHVSPSHVCPNRKQPCPGGEHPRPYSERTPQPHGCPACPRGWTWGHQGNRL